MNTLEKWLRARPGIRVVQFTALAPAMGLSSFRVDLIDVQPGSSSGLVCASAIGHQIISAALRVSTMITDDDVPASPDQIRRSK